MPQIEQIAPLVTRRLRQRVLYPNQSIAKVILDEDDYGIHFGLYDHDRLIAVVSLFLDGITARFRKFAVDQAYQGQGYGQQLLDYIVTYAAQEGIQSLWCDARITASAFYKKYGFNETGQAFMKNDIAYIRMEKQINTDNTKK